MTNEMDTDNTEIQYRDLDNYKPMSKGTRISLFDPYGKEWTVIYRNRSSIHATKVAESVWTINTKANSLSFYLFKSNDFDEWILKCWSCFNMYVLFVSHKNQYVSCNDLIKEYKCHGDKEDWKKNEMTKKIPVILHEYKDKNELQSNIQQISNLLMKWQLI